MKFARQIWRRDDVNGVRQDRNQHSHKSAIWLAVAALSATALGPVLAAAQTDEPPEPPNLRASRSQLEFSPGEAPVEDALGFERYNIRGDLPPVVPYIIGGGPAEPNTFSWQVDLGICGGTLIARDWVLTAAHCVLGGRPNPVRVGSYERGGGQEIEVSTVHFHPDYSENPNYDIALLHLATEAPESLGVVALPDLATHNRLAAPGRTATAIGWGLTESNSMPSDLQQADLLLEGCVRDNISDISAIYRDYRDHSYSVCTTNLLFTDLATNTCFGDSGGPLLGRDGGTYYQIGITSRLPSVGTGASACNEGAIFTRVVSFLDWISSVTGIAFIEPPAAPEDPMAVDICSRTAAVRDEILSIAGVADCAAVTDADLAAITRMDLSDAGLTALQEGDFAGLSGLTFLDLRDNGLTQLPQSLFADLAALAELVLHRNSLRTLPVDVFDPLATLTYLDLADNSLTRLPEGLFDNLSGLIVLNISRNDITALPEAVFDELGSLNTLNLGGNPLAEVPEGIFADLTELRILSLGDRTGSLTLTDGVFDGLEGLLWLRLRGVELLSADVFAGTPDLLELEVANGALLRLPAGTFDDLTSLNEVNLLGNPLAAVPEGIFADLIELKRLFLGDSTGSLTVTAGMFDGLEGLRWLRLLGVESLTADAFAGTPNLDQLYIFDGALSSLPAGVFDNLSSLTLLSLAGNPITAVPEGIFANLIELERLSLGDSTEVLPLTIDIFEDLAQDVADAVKNQAALALLTLTDGVFDGLEGLLWLRLRGVESLTADVFAGTPNLERLDIFSGTLLSLPAGLFDNLSGLTELGVDGYPLAALPEGIFVNLTGLKILTLTDSAGSLALTSGVFDGLEELVLLSLLGVESLTADVFAGTPNLLELDLFDSALSSLPAGLFDNLSRLETLRILRCGIAVLPSRVFERLTNLRWLDLQGNELTTLPAGIFAGLPYLHFLDLADNPGIPFILVPKLQLVGSGHRNGTVKLRVFIAEGAPFETSVGWTATGEVVGAATGKVSVPGGSLYGEPFELTGADSRGQLSIALSHPMFSQFSAYNSSELRLAVGDPLTLDFATLPSSTLPSFGQQFVVDEDIPEIPTVGWTPDLLSRASFSQVGGQTAITFSHGGRVEEEGVAYTCMSSGGCEIEGTRVAKGIILVSEPAAQAELMVAGVGQFVDEKTVFQEKVYNGYELGDSTLTLRSVAGEITRVSFLDPGGDLVFADFSSDDPATEMVITLEEFPGTLEGSPYNQPETRYARGLATVTMVNPTELTWLEVISLGNHLDRVALALIKHDTFAGAVDGMADLQAVVIEGEGSMGAIDAANANFVSSFGTIGIDAGGAIVKRALSIGDITPSEGTTPVLRISADSLDPANAGKGETVIGEILIAGGDLREAKEQLQIDTAEVEYEFPIVAVEGELSIRDSELRPDLGDGILDAVTDTFVADPDAYFVTDGQTTNSADATE